MRIGRTLLCLCATMLWAAPAPAQTWPTKTVRIIVPFPAGQATDILARVLADQLTKSLGQPVVAENRGGAGGTIGAAAAAKAEPDGHTLAMATIATHGIAPGLYAKLAYDPLRDFAPIANVGLTPQVLMANKDAGINSLQDLVAKATAREIDYGSSGNGSASHLSAEMLKAAARLKLTHVPFKGNADALTALHRGDITILFDAIPGALPHVKAGAVKGIGIAALQRSPFLPDLPTLAEQGLPGFEAVGWIGLAAPAGTPAAILDRLNGEVRRILADPAVQERLKTLAFVPVGDTREQFTAFIASEIAKWSKVTREAGIKVD
jgi:tripartite-type tricarboxylate transporter receptor subunit TctC